MPSEEVQISSQIFAVEMAKHLANDKGVNPAEAIAKSTAATRLCMVNLDLLEGEATGSINVQLENMAIMIFRTSPPA
jgi:hypothetical protein